MLGLSLSHDQDATTCLLVVTVRRMVRRQERHLYTENNIVGSER